MSNTPELLEGAQRFEQPDEGRKAAKFLQKFTAAVTLAVAQLMSGNPASAEHPYYPQPVKDEKPIDINSYIRNFPVAEEIDGIAKTHRYCAENPKYALIHFRMRHYVPNLSRSDSDEVLACQRKLRKAMQHSITHPQIQMNHLYVEGITKKDNGLSIFNDQRLPSGVFSRNTYLMRYWGADAVLQETHGLRLKPAETEAARALADSVGTKKEYDHRVYENREDALLQLIHQAGDRIAFVLYGANHNWENNIIDRWNKQHPEARFSYLELLPETLENHDNRDYSGGQYTVHLPAKASTPSIAAK